MPHYGGGMGTGKAALQIDAKQLAWFVGDKNIRVNLISAGPYASRAARAINKDFDKLDRARRGALAAAPADRAGGSGQRDAVPVQPAGLGGDRANPLRRLRVQRHGDMRREDAGVPLMNPLEALRAAMAPVDAYYKERGIFQDRFGFGEPGPCRYRHGLRLDRPRLRRRLGAARSGDRRDPSAPAARAEKKHPRLLHHVAISRIAAVQVGGRLLARFPQVGPRAACEIDERVRPLPAETLIEKEHASAFAGTPLVGHLIEHRVDTLLITGCSTSACVRATATDAKSNGLKPIIVREAVQDRSEIAHEWTLFDIQARFADVVSLDETLAYLQSLAVVRT